MKFTATKTWKAYLFVGGIATFLMGLFLVTILAVPLLINSEIFKDRLYSAISQGLGVEMGFERADFSLLPRPVVVIHQATFKKRNIGEATVRSLSARFEILPLHAGP